MKRWFSLILAGCMLMQLTLGSSSGYMKAETESEGPAEVSDEVQVQNVEPQLEAAEEQEQSVQNVSEEETQTQDQKDEKPRTTPIEQNSNEGKEEPVRKQINGSITVSFLTGKGLSERQSFQLTLKHGSEEETRTAVLEAAQGASAVSAVSKIFRKAPIRCRWLRKGIEHMSRYFRWTGMIKAFSCILVQHRSCLRMYSRDCWHMRHRMYKLRIS